MLSPTHPLQQRRYGTRGAQLTNKIDRTDVDAQFQRSGGDERFQLAAFQSIFRIEPQFCRKTAVM